MPLPNERLPYVCPYEYERVTRDDGDCQPERYVPEALEYECDNPPEKLRELW
jgi:hypothetical protein